MQVVADNGTLLQLGNDSALGAGALTINVTARFRRVALRVHFQMHLSSGATLQLAGGIILQFSALLRAAAALLVYLQSTIPHQLPFLETFFWRETTLLRGV